MEKMIEPDKQQKHTTIRFEECYAKIVLEDLFPEQFCNLDLKDRPDLQNEELDIGIEVTSAIDQKQREAESLYFEMTEENDAKKEKQKTGATLADGILFGKPIRIDFYNINEALESKLKKLASEQYKNFNKQYLFIFSTIYATAAMREEALAEMQTISAESGQKFNEVFVLVPKRIYVFDLDHNTFCEKVISRSKQIGHANGAIKMVEEKERECAE